MAEDFLIVDGYNIIGAWPHLRELAGRELEEARDRLIEILANYQGYSGKKIIIVFDAYQVPGLGVKLEQHKLDIRYTREKETADECIERLVGELKQRGRRIEVATSDHTEQRVVFGQGALRLSARELLLLVEESQGLIDKGIRKQREATRNTFDHRMSEELRELFERWRRGNK